MGEVKSVDSGFGRRSLGYGGRLCLAVLLGLARWRDSGGTLRGSGLVRTPECEDAAVEGKGGKPLKTAE